MKVTLSNENPPTPSTMPISATTKPTCESKKNALNSPMMCMSAASNMTTGPHQDGWTDALDQCVATRPQQPSRDDGYEKAVAVFVLTDPAPDQFPKRCR